MKHLPVFFLAAFLTFSGCKKHGVPSASNTTTPTNDAAAASTAPTESTLPPPPRYVAAQAQNAPQQGVSGPVDPFLTQQLQIYIKQTGRMPQSFTEFAGARLDSIPLAPKGTKWAIDSTSMQVKAVPNK